MISTLPITWLSSHTTKGRWMTWQIALQQHQQEWVSRSTWRKRNLWRSNWWRVHQRSQVVHLSGECSGQTGWRRPWQVKNRKCKNNVHHVQEHLSLKEHPHKNQTANSNVIPIQFQRKIHFTVCNRDTNYLKRSKHFTTPVSSTSLTSDGLK
jgi:hypothetical protein